MPGIARLYSLYKLSYLHFHVSQAVRRHCYALLRKRPVGPKRRDYDVTKLW
jgi:hypothetical protein